MGRFFKGAQHLGGDRKITKGGTRSGKGPYNGDPCKWGYKQKFVGGERRSRKTCLRQRESDGKPPRGEHEQEKEDLVESKGGPRKPS